MGGQAAGEIASKRAIEMVPRELRKQLSHASNHEQCKAVIRRAIDQANQEILQMGALDRDLRNMGTTIVMGVWRKGPELYITWVGDSRAYLIRDGAIQQLTVDHSLAQALVDNKTISAAEAKEHRFKNVLWKYLGSKEVKEEEIQVLVQPIQAGDRFLLCTDGLCGPASDEQILKFMLETPDVQQCAEGLGQLALDCNSRDNVSCIVIEVVE
jgi:PPM family protein phosphatase